MVTDLHLSVRRPATLVLFAALSLAGLDRVWFEQPEQVLDGVVCGNCLKLGVDRAQARHASAKHVQRCYQVWAVWDAETRAEQAAEAANERFFEERGYEEARLQEQVEAQLGIPC